LRGQVELRDRFVRRRREWIRAHSGSVAQISTGLPRFAK
jgi:hypothetical protein